MLLKVNRWSKKLMIICGPANVCDLASRKVRRGSASGLEITSTGPTSIEKASGQSVKLDCQFILGPEDSGPLDIEWSLLSSDNQNEDKVCKVKKAPGIRSRKMLLIVMAPNTAGFIAAGIIAVLLILIIIAIILFCCCRARYRKKYEKEICNEISQRSSLGSMSPSNLHEYALKPQYDKIPSSEDFERPPSHAPLPPPTGARMAGPNLSRYGGHPRHDPCPEPGRVDRLRWPL
ncbi:unnamed protein product [Lampetra planeri]